MSQQAARRGFYFAPQCAKCGMSTGIFEVLGPDDLPQRWGCWDEGSRRLHADQTTTDAWRILVVAGALDNGVVGEPIDLDDESAADLHRRLLACDVEALESVSDELLGYCTACSGFYCHLHWSKGPSRACPVGHPQDLGSGCPDWS